MKKIFVLLLLLMSTVVFSETLERMSYRNGMFTGTLRENNQVNIEAVKGRTNEGSVLILSIPDVTNNASSPRIEGDPYLKSISAFEQGNELKMYFFLKEGTSYTVFNSKKEFQIKFENPNIVSDRESGRINREKEGKVKEPSRTTDTPDRRPSNKKGTYTIVVDPGHGGHDSGAVGNGYREKDLALQIGLKLGEELRKDYNVIMTRTTDVFKTLQERPEMGNVRSADLFVSVHLNSSGSSSASGTEVYYYAKKDDDNYSRDVAKFNSSTVDSGIAMSDYALKDINYRMNQTRSSALAQDVLDGLLNNFAVKDRGVKNANFAVLRGSNSPSILIELGFVSNYSDVSQFVNDYDQERAAKSIADAIRKHFMK